MRRAATLSTRKAGVSACALLALLSACSKEPPPRTVIEFVENPRLLEATMVRCAESRDELRYTGECVNAREAVDRIAATEEAASRSELDAQSERKRESLRRAQQAAVAARQRAAEAERLREEAEYLGQFGEVEEIPVETTTGGQPIAPDRLQPDSDAVIVDEPAPAMSPANEAPPVNEPKPPAESGVGSLESVRDELQRRQQSDSQ